MRYMFDTNMCIYLIRQRPTSVMQKVARLSANSIALSTIVVSELAYGTAKSQRRTANLASLEQLLKSFVILPFDHAAALVYGTIRADLERQGTPIGAMDLLIAAHAVSQNLTLVTNNEREFTRIVGLKVENWT